MKANRREFIATTAGALVALQASPAIAQQKRTLRITFEGLAVIAVSKDKDPTAKAGLPANSPRVDVLFLKHDEHEPPVAIQVDNSLDRLELNDRYLVIKVNKQDLAAPINKEKGTPGVTLDTTAESPCAKNNWSGLRNLPQCERFLSTRVDVLSSELGTSPVHLASRVTLRRGGLAGELPMGRYAESTWSFPPTKLAAQEYTDHCTWTIEIEKGDVVTLEAVPFAGGAAKSFQLQGTTDSLAVVVGSVRKLTSVPPDPKVADHFAHYYDVLDYQGQVKPLPTITGKACQPKTPPTLTKIQEDFLKQLKSALDRLRPAKQQEDCGTGEMLRGEPGICLNAIAYSTAK